MRGWRLSPEGLAPSELEVAALASDQVRVQVEAVCLEAEDLLRAGEHCPGGGLVGQVIECGDAASAYQGLRVLVSPVAACGECDTCRRGFASVCPSRTILGQDLDGGCAESVVASARWLTTLDAGKGDADKGLSLDTSQAALVAGPALLAYAMYCRAGVSAGDLVIVLGCGPRAAILSKLASGRGASVLCGHGLESAQEIEDSLAGMDAKGRPMRIFVCDSASAAAADNDTLALQIAAPGSVITTCAAAGSVDFAQLLDRELSILALPYAHPDLMPETAALVAKGELDLQSFACTESLGSASADRARAAFAQGQCLVLRH